MWLVLKILSQLEQSGADIGLSDNFGIEAVEVELMVECKYILMSFHIFSQLFLGGECVLDEY